MGGSLVAGIPGGRDDTFPNIFAIHVFPKEDDQGGTSQISPVVFWILEYKDHIDE